MDIKKNHPAAGEVITSGHLRSRGLYIQRSRIRASLRRVDAAGVEDRRLQTIQRRVYYAPSPNYVWHIDGTHKLIKWKFVVHSAIDGFSRLITFCKCSTNNKSSTVLKHFVAATEKYGFPLRVRTDYGVENVGVWEHVYRTSLNSNSVIVGTSVHNQRIERLHRDVNVQVLNHFYNEFRDLEDQGLLDATNDTDLFCLHLVYLPSINRRLSEFVNASNHHSLSTENNQTPLQLFHFNIRLLQLQSLDPSGLFDVNDIVSRSRNDVQVAPVETFFGQTIQEGLASFVSRNQHLENSVVYQRLSMLISQILDDTTAQRVIVST